MSENDTPRAEAGFRPTTQWPHVVDLEQRTSTDDEPMIVAQGDLRNTAEALGSMELLAAILKQSIPSGSPVAEELGRLEGMARFWKQHVRLIGGIAAAFVMAVGVLAAGVVSPAPAAAATVPATVPAVEAPEPDAGIAQHRTKFGRGYWFDQGSGDVYIVAPLLELAPVYGWLPSPGEKVIVQESTKRGIRTRGTLTSTNVEGLARGLLHVGGGVHYLRVMHPADQWTLGTVGTWRRVVITTEPCDIV